ncbi:hypothetical protein [Nonomuraea lactucae]|uniref:hypothetical protein n=1 Tax=Nonomuraea lactucae TaxID=2249762 RepID=UPI0013B42C42|nr:hypothetical protein [Nonomuraea lactucae]
MASISGNARSPRQTRAAALGDPAVIGAVSCIHRDPTGQSQRLLRDSEAPLSAAARQVGCASEFAFANDFKREYGIALGKYRRQERTTT